jgi:capsular exopolysaccharide synthesis family protein
MTLMTDPLVPDEEGASNDLSYLWALLIRRMWLIALCFFSVVLLAIGYILEARPLYASTAVVEVMQEEQRAFNASHVDSSADLRSMEILHTIEQNLQGHALLESVVRDPDINSDPDFIQTVVHAGEKSVSFAELADRLQAMVRVSLERGTRLIAITVYHPKPALAQKLAQKIVDQYELLNGATQTETNRSDMQFLVKQADGVKDNLQKSENSLSIYREALVLKDRVEDQERIIEALQQRYRAKHPEMIQAVALLADIRLKFDQEIQRVLASSKTEADFWAQYSSDIDSTSNDARINSELKVVDARTSVLQREVDTETALFDNVLRQMKDADLSKEATPTQIRMTEPPELPTVPYSPHKNLILAFASVLGLILGVILVFVLNAFDSSIKTAPEAEEFFRLPVLGTIPYVHTAKRRGRPVPEGAGAGASPADGSNDLVLLAHSSGAAAESFRSLRASLGLLGKVEDRRTVLFTSAFADEGKTFISTNYATALAQQGLRTLLIDTDLRRPSIHEVFNLPQQPGFVDLVTQGLDFGAIVQQNVVENLDILTGGSRCPNPAELLGGSAFAETLREALAHYDRIVIDSSPVNLVSDTLLVAPYVQSVCLVLRTARTPRRGVLHALGMLNRSEARPVGVILNFVPNWSGYVSYAPYGYRAKDASKYRSVYSS